MHRFPKLLNTGRISVRFVDLIKAYQLSTGVRLAPTSSKLHVLPACLSLGQGHHWTSFTDQSLHRLCLIMTDLMCEVVSLAETTKWNVFEVTSTL